MLKVAVRGAEFLLRHRQEARSFIRERKLPFISMLGLILRKSAKSLQLVLNEFSELLNIDGEVTASAFTQARRKLNATAFVELNHLLVNKFYHEEEYERYKGHRLCAIDGTLIRLPISRNIREEFGEILNRGNNGGEGFVCQGRASVLYDVLNGLVLDAVLTSRKVYERELAESHLQFVREGDLLLFDRGYPRYRMFCKVLESGGDFIIRRRKRMGKRAKSPYEEVVKLRCPKREEGLPAEIQVRFVSVELPSGEVEILATSLIDEKRYPTEDFKDLYFKRWGNETFFKVLKSRLGIENFTGKTALAVNQDFYSTILVTTLESILTREAEEKLNQKHAKYSQKSESCGKLSCHKAQSARPII